MSSDLREKQSFTESEAVEVLREQRAHLAILGETVIVAALDAALASLSAPKPEGDNMGADPGEWGLEQLERRKEELEGTLSWIAYSGTVDVKAIRERARTVLPSFNDNAVAVNESPEAVGTISQSHPMMGSGFMHAFICKTRLPDGTKVYTAPPRPEASEGVEDETLALIVERAFKAGASAALARQPAAADESALFRAADALCGEWNMHYPDAVRMSKTVLTAILAGQSLKNESDQEHQGGTQE